MSEDNTYNDSHNIIWDKSTLNSISGNYVWIIGGSFIKWNPDYFTALDITVDDDKLTEATSLIWSIKRHKWITGPQLPDEIMEDTQDQTDMLEFQAI